jgi:hypothetical protein
MKRSPRLSTVLLSILSLSGCDGYTFQYVAPFTRDFTFNLDTQSAPSATATLTRNQILGSLDIPANALLFLVSVESVKIVINPDVGNAVTQATLSVLYDELPGPPGPEMFSANITLPVGSGTEQTLSQLQPAAVARFSDNFKSMLESFQPSSISLALSSVTRTPAAARLHISGRVTISGSITVQECRDRPAFAFMGGPDEDCIQSAS